MEHYIIYIVLHGRPKPNAQLNDSFAGVPTVEGPLKSIPTTWSTMIKLYEAFLCVLKIAKCLHNTFTIRTIIRIIV